MQLPKTTEVQSLLFDREVFTVRQAKAWAKKHKFRLGKVDSTDNYHRLRQHDPAKFQARSIRTKTFTTGLKGLVGRPLVGGADAPPPRYKGAKKKLERLAAVEPGRSLKIGARVYTVMSKPKSAKLPTAYGPEMELRTNARSGSRPYRLRLPKHHNDVAVLTDVEINSHNPVSLSRVTLGKKGGAPEKKAAKTGAGPTGPGFKVKRTPRGAERASKAYVPMPGPDHIYPPAESAHEQVVLGILATSADPQKMDAIVQRATRETGKPAKEFKPGLMRLARGGWVHWDSKRDTYEYPAPEVGAKAEADVHAARELELWIDNDADLYRQQHVPIQKNLRTKMARGVYDKEKAVKLFMYLTENGAQSYTAKPHGPGWPAKWHEVFNKPTREMAARSLVETFDAEARLGNYDYLLPKKYQGHKVEGGACTLTDSQMAALGAIARQSHGRLMGVERRDIYSPTFDVLLRCGFIEDEDARFPKKAARKHRYVATSEGERHVRDGGGGEIGGLDDVVPELIRMEAESMGVECDPAIDDLVSTETQDVVDLYDIAVTEALEDIPEDWFLSTDARLALLEDDSASYDILMTLRGEGVGIWDGRWECYMDEKNVERAEKRLKGALRKFADDSGAGALSEAFMADAERCTGDDDDGEVGYLGPLSTGLRYTMPAMARMGQR